MTLEEVQAEMDQDRVASQQEAEEELKRDERRIIGKLAELGVVAADGWLVQSLFPQESVVLVTHPRLPNVVRAFSDFEYAGTWLRGYIVGENSNSSYALYDIKVLVAAMSKEIEHGEQPKEPPKLRCPILSAGDAEWSNCCREQCAWWSTYYGKCARVVIPSSGIV